MIKTARTYEQLATALDMTRQGLVKGWIDKPGFPKKKKNLWNVDECAAFVRAYKATKEKITGENRDLKRLKLQKEIEMLDVKIAALKSELISVQELHDEVTSVSGIFIDACKHLVQRSKLTRNLEIVRLAEQVADDVKENIRGLIDQVTIRHNRADKVAISEDGSDGSS